MNPKRAVKADDNISSNSEINTIQGHLDAADKKFVMVVSRFNELISKKLLEGALDCLVRHGAKQQNLTIVWVPGSFEIPLAAVRLAKGCWSFVDRHIQLPKRQYRIFACCLSMALVCLLSLNSFYRGWKSGDIFPLFISILPQAIWLLSRAAELPRLS